MSKIEPKISEAPDTPTEAEEVKLLKKLLGEPVGYLVPHMDQAIAAINTALYGKR